MVNEILLLTSLIFIYATVLLSYKLFGKTGLYIWTSIATITANIEVIILIKAFGLEQTLGNILFASTFLVSDILSENEGVHEARKAVFAGIFANIVFVIISQSWFLYHPSPNDWAIPFMSEVFSNIPRFMIAGITVYAISQILDVWLYDKIWQLTKTYFNNSTKGLWIRNNGSTMISQAVNNILFSFAAFYGIEGYDISVIWNLIISSYIISLVTSLCDTPAVYLAKKMKTTYL